MIKRTALRRGFSVIRAASVPTSSAGDRLLSGGFQRAGRGEIFPEYADMVKPNAANQYSW